MKKSLKFLIIIFFLQSNNIISGQEIDDFEKEKNIEFLIIINEKGNFNPEGNLSIQYKNEVGIIHIFGTLNLGTKLNPFRIGFFDKQVLKEIYDELVDFLNDDYNKLGNSSADSDEGRLSIRSCFPGKRTIQKTIVYYSNYNCERFALYYDKIISLALQYSVIPKISEYYIKDGIKQKLENYKTKNKYFEGLNFITKYTLNGYNFNIFK